MVTSLRDGSVLLSDILQATRHDRYLAVQRCTINIDSVLTWKRSIIRLVQVSIWVAWSVIEASHCLILCIMIATDGEALSDNLMATSEARDSELMIGSDLTISHPSMLLMLSLQLSCPMPICDARPSCTSPETTSWQLRIAEQAPIEIQVSTRISSMVSGNCSVAHRCVLQ